MKVTTDDSSFDIDFGQRLSRARTQRGVSLRDLALALGGRGVSLDSAALSRIENGKRAPKLRETVAISECLGVPLAQLLPEVGEQHEASARYQLERSLEDAAAKLTALAGRLDYTMLVHGDPGSWADRVIEHAVDIFENPHRRIDSSSPERADAIGNVLRIIAPMAVRAAEGESITSDRAAFGAPDLEFDGDDEGKPLPADMLFTDSESGDGEYQATS